MCTFEIKREGKGRNREGRELTRVLIEAHRESLTHGYLGYVQGGNMNKEKEWVMNEVVTMSYVQKRMKRVSELDV